MTDDPHPGKAGSEGRAHAQPANPVLAEVWRGPVLESVHRGRVAVATPEGQVVAGLGALDGAILPRSASKPLQAMALVASGAADRAGLGTRHLALACASHSAQPEHVGLLTDWLASLGLGEAALACGAHPPLDEAAAHALARAGTAPDQRHNNCSGKHAGFLTASRDLGGGRDYLSIDHPVQRAVMAGLSEMTGADLGPYAVDGCSAPNHAMSLAALATGFARLGTPAGLGATHRDAAGRLCRAMAAHPVLVAGRGRANTILLQATAGRAVMKSGAEGVYAAALPARGLGVAVKIDDGADRAAQAVIAAVLVALGAADAAHPDIAALIDRTLQNRRGIAHGRLLATAETRRLTVPNALVSGRALG
ncbi:MAG: asparaginase [Pseudomonadota bacterium]